MGAGTLEFPSGEHLFVISGGGFRDSLADMSEELCPSSADTPVPLPFFVRTANQVIYPYFSSCFCCLSLQTSQVLNYRVGRGGTELHGAASRQTGKERLFYSQRDHSGPLVEGLQASLWRVWGNKVGSIPCHADSSMLGAGQWHW